MNYAIYFNKKYNRSGHLWQGRFKSWYVTETRRMLEDITDIKERNKQILKAIEQGYSQHMIAKVLGISQQAVGGVVKRSK